MSKQRKLTPHNTKKRWQSLNLCSIRTFFGRALFGQTFGQTFGRTFGYAISSILYMLPFVVSANGIGSTVPETPVKSAAATPAISPSLPFNKHAFEGIKQTYRNRQWLLVLWSVDCPSCYKELAYIDQLAVENPQRLLPVVLINTDDFEDVSEQKETVIQQFNLAKYPRYDFQIDQASQSRFIIDPSWYGELPRSYFVNRNGEFTGKSGLVDKEVLESWLLGSGISPEIGSEIGF